MKNKNHINYSHNVKHCIKKTYKRLLCMNSSLKSVSNQSVYLLKTKLMLMSLFSLSGPAICYWANSSVSSNPHNASTGTFLPSRWTVYTVPYCVWTAASQYGDFVSIINKLEQGEDRLWMDTAQLFDNYGATVSLNWDSAIQLLTTGEQGMREIINDLLSMPLPNSFMSVIDCIRLSFLRCGKIELSWQ